MIKYQTIDITHIVTNLMYGDLADLDDRIKKFKKAIEDVLSRESGHTNTRFTCDGGNEPTEFYLKLERPLNNKEKASEQKVAAFYEEQDRNTLKSLLKKYGVPEEFQ